MIEVKKGKQRLYWLIDQFLERKIDASTFCDEYYYCYDLDLEDNLSKMEEEMFNNLSIIASRFSPIDEEHTKYPDVYFTEEQLRNKAFEVKTVLG